MILGPKSVFSMRLKRCICSSKNIIKYGVFGAPRPESYVFYDVFEKPEIEFYVKVAKNIIKYNTFEQILDAFAISECAL